jgi:hypothetical protein
LKFQGLKPNYTTTFSDGLKSLCENADSAQPAAKQAAEKIAGLCLPLLKLFFST